MVVYDKSRQTSKEGERQQQLSSLAKGESSRRALRMFTEKALMVGNLHHPALCHHTTAMLFLLFCLAASHAARSTQHTRKNKGLCVFVALFCFVFLHLRQRLLKSAAPCASGRRLKSPAQLKPRPATKPADMSTRTRVLGVEAPPALCRFFMRLFCAARKTTTPFFCTRTTARGAGASAVQLRALCAKLGTKKKPRLAERGAGKRLAGGGAAARGGAGWVTPPEREDPVFLGNSPAALWGIRGVRHPRCKKEKGTRHTHDSALKKHSETLEKERERSVEEEVVFC